MLALLLATALAAPVRAVIVSEPITVDGVLDEAAWASASPVTDFRRFQPTAGGPPPGRTEVRFLTDDDNLYVGIRVSGLQTPVRARWTPREQINEDDQIGLYLDTFRDGRSGYIFYLNALGIQQDIRFNAGRWDMAWDTVVHSRGTVADDGYSIEVALPFRSVKYAAADGEREWGVLVTRKVPGEGAKYSFPAQERDHPFLFEQAETLLLTAPRQGSGLEIMPSVTLLQGYGSPDGQADPRWTGFDPWHTAIRPSLDARFGITPNTGVAVAVNPDFSQVEHDAIQVDPNQLYAFFYPEQRPFFLDGADLLYDRHELLYSRSINDPIYGLKLTGKEGPLSLGVVHALDRTPLPSITLGGTPGFDEEDVEDRWAQNTVARGALDVSGSGHVGLMLAEKRILTTDMRTTALNEVASLDFRLPLGGRWRVEGASTHSITRKDREDWRWGHGSSLMLERASGVGTGFKAEIADLSPEARAEMSFTPFTGATLWDLELDHTLETPGVFDLIQPGVGIEGQVERNGDHQMNAVGWLWTQFAGVATAEAWGGFLSNGRDGETAHGPVIGMSHQAQVGRFSWSPWWEYARVLDYEALVAADAFSSGVTLSAFATRHLRVDTTGTLRLHAPAGLATERAASVRLRATYQVDRVLGVRILGDLATEGQQERAIGSGLITWLLHPGTAVWVGYAGSAALGEGPTGVSHTVFAKVSLLARP